MITCAYGCDFTRASQDGYCDELDPDYDCGTPGTSMFILRQAASEKL